MKQTLNPLIHELLLKHNDSDVSELITHAKETGNPKFLKTLSQATPARTFNRCLHELEVENKVRNLNPQKDTKWNPKRGVIPKWRAFEDDPA